MLRTSAVRQPAGRTDACRRLGSARYACDKLMGKQESKRGEKTGARVEHARRPMSLASEERSQFATIWWLSSSTVTKSNRDCAKLFTPT